MMFIVSCLYGVVVFQSVLWWQEQRERRSTQAHLHPESPVCQSDSLLLRHTYRMARGLAPYMTWCVPAAFRAWTQRHMARAGWTMITPEHMIAQSLIVSVGSGAIVAILSPVAPIVCASVMASIGLMLPWWWLLALAARRVRDITIELESFVELLALAAQSGSSVVTAIARIVEWMPSSALRRLLQSLHRDVRMGVSEVQAWETFALRAAAPRVDTFVALMVQAQRFGTPIADVLHAQAQAMQDARCRLAEQQGAKASHKVLLPVVVCILPAYFLLIFGGPVIHFWTNGFKGFLP